MGTNSKIEWTDHTWNPWYGCPDDGRRSPACDNCYARAWARRSGIVDFDNEIKRAKPATFEAPLSDRYKPGDRVFVCSLSDFFHEAVPDSLFVEAFRIIYARPDLTWIILTKRPENISIPYNWPVTDECDPPKNIWLGVTVENQEQADRRIPQLLQIPAAMRFVSIEPMLGPITLVRRSKSLLRNWLRGNGQTLDWVICGGETGPGHRSPEIKWVWDLALECQKAGVPYFAKYLPFSCDPPASWMRREFPEVTVHAK